MSAAGVVLAGFPNRVEAEGALERFLRYDPSAARGCRIVPARVRRRPGGPAPL